MAMDVLLTYDNLGEAYDLFRFGHAGGAAADGVYAIRRGVPRLLDVLARRELRATFFVEGWGAQRYPALVAAIAAAGHEIGAHGWLHEEWGQLGADDERELIRRTTGTIGDILGAPPQGWRSPGGRTTPRTLRLLADAGYRYDSSFIDEDVPYRLQVAAGDERTLLELPMSPVLSDTPFYAYPGTLRSPAEVTTLWWEELTGLAGGADFAVVTTHPRHSARPARLAAHERFLARLLDGELGAVRFLRGDEAAREYGQRDDLPAYPPPVDQP